ncbi:hypothetical protein LCGC14_1571800, partial [marine sediment metagenome]
MIDILHQKPLLGRQVDWAHPLAKGLVGCWLFNETSGNKVYDLSNNGGDGDITQFTWGDSGLTHDALNDQNIALPSAYTPLDGGVFTVISRVKVFSITADRGIFYTDVHAGSEPLLLWFDNAGVDHFGALVSTTSTTTASILGGIVPIADRWYSVCLTWDGSTIRLYIDGIEDTAGGFPASFAGVLQITDSQYHWGNDNGLTRDLLGVIEYGMIYNRGFTAKEALLAHREPYVMFQQNRAKLFSVTGGIAVFASISDGLGISDTIVTKTGYIRSAADSVGISDVLTRIATYIRSLASNLATTDTINTARNLK